LRNQDFRHSRRREFDTDTHHPQSRAFGTQPWFAQTRFEEPSGDPVRAVVKWFSPEKGFGFVELSDEFGDGFLHGSVLARTGISAVQPGDTLEVRVGPGHKGPHVTEVLSVHSSIAARVAPRRSSATPDSPPPATGIEETGTVKWFNAERAYGFIARDSGGKDVFVHISALERSGITSLIEGQPVIVDFVEGRKGLEAVRVRLV
jgi:CspA family cold shock protein